jgi:hypothetical protein
LQVVVVAVGRKVQVEVVVQVAVEVRVAEMVGMEIFGHRMLQVVQVELSANLAQGALLLLIQHLAQLDKGLMQVVEVVEEYCQDRVATMALTPAAAQVLDLDKGEVQVAVALARSRHMIQLLGEVPVVQQVIQAMVQAFYLVAQVAADGVPLVVMAILLLVVPVALEEKRLIDLVIH